MALLRRFLKYEIHSLRIALISGIIGVLFMIVAISTSSWTQIRYILLDINNKNVYTSVHEHYGIWKYCKSILMFVDGNRSGPSKLFLFHFNILQTPTFTIAFIVNYY